MLLSNQSAKAALPPGTNLVHTQQPISNCPIGLEYLTQVDQLLVQQIPSKAEALTGWEKNNKYVVRNKAGQQVYYAVEATDSWMRVCCGSKRSFTMHILDNFHQLQKKEVLRVSRDFKCLSGCCWFAGCCQGCSDEVAIETPTGEVLGFIRQGFSMFKPKFNVLDKDRKKILKIIKPCCFCYNPCFCSRDVEFRVHTLSGDQIGTLKKLYSGFVLEKYSDEDNFTVSFPVEMEVKVKALLFGALFLIQNPSPSEEESK